VILGLCFCRVFRLQLLCGLMVVGFRGGSCGYSILVLGF